MRARRKSVTAVLIVFLLAFMAWILSTPKENSISIPNLGEKEQIMKYQALRELRDYYPTDQLVTLTMDDEYKSINELKEETNALNDLLAVNKNADTIGRSELNSIYRDLEISLMIVELIILIYFAYQLSVGKIRVRNGVLFNEK